MPIKVLMPALSPTMTEGNITKWLKKEGEKISAGEVIAEIETDKATMEVEAVDEGIVAKLLVPAGAEGVPVNSLIAVLVEENEKDADIDSFISDMTAKKVSEPANKPQSVEPTTEITVPARAASPESGFIDETKAAHISKAVRIFASPLAKRVAAMEGVSLEGIHGSGPRGRIVKADVLSAGKNNGSRIRRQTEPYRPVPNNNMRKIIAKRLLESKQNVPHFYLSIECMMDAVFKAREQINASLEEETKKISINDFIILASARALKDVPAANASWSNEAIMMYNNIDISVAVAVEGGLITPIIKNADQKDIIKISMEMKDLIKKARENSLTPEEFQGGSFSISNLGMYGVKNFNAIINPPQGCILAAGMSAKRPVVIGDKVKVRTIMDATLSCDHRVVDGAIGARFLAAFKRYIEAPILMFI